MAENTNPQASHSDEEFRCPYCRATTLKTSAGRTGLEKAASLIRAAMERIPDQYRGYIGDLGRFAQNLEAEGHQFADLEEM